MIARLLIAHRASRRFFVACCLAASLSIWCAQAADPPPDAETEVTEEEVEMLRVESVRWAKSAVAKANEETVKLENKLRTAKQGTERDEMMKQRNLYILAAAYYQGFVDVAAAQEVVMERTLAVNSALLAERPKVEVERLKAALRDEHTRVQTATDAYVTAEAAYKAAVGDQLMDPYTAVAQILAKRKAGQK